VVLIGADRKTVIKRGHKKHRSVCSFFFVRLVQRYDFDFLLFYLSTNPLKIPEIVFRFL